MEYKILAYTVIIMIVIAIIIAITKATKTTKDDNVGNFLNRFLESFLGLLEKILPFYKRNK